jgi:outer membrane lipoprotein-sorting protein
VVEQKRHLRTILDGYSKCETYKDLGTFEYEYEGNSYYRYSFKTFFKKPQKLFFQVSSESDKWVILSSGLQVHSHASDQIMPDYQKYPSLSDAFSTALPSPSLIISLVPYLLISEMRFVVSDFFNNGFTEFENNGLKYVSEWKPLLHAEIAVNENAESISRIEFSSKSWATEGYAENKLNTSTSVWDYSYVSFNEEIPDKIFDFSN